MSSLGTLATIWATVVLLGGFSTLIKKDFWYVTVIAFVQSIGLGTYRAAHSRHRNRHHCSGPLETLLFSFHSILLLAVVTEDKSVRPDLASLEVAATRSKDMGKDMI
uniref:DUF4220 domain-containing protein n=1 Tax=Oryza meridionalis TaxID=40149 RepID=A0A0E0DLR5_9ORYZ